MLRYVGTALMAAGLAVFAGSPASAAPGDNGTVKIHDSVTNEENPQNEPKVCEFYLVGFNFDAGQEVSWRIVAGPPFKGDAVASGTLVLDEEGHGRTADMTLPDGHYKLYWTFEGKKGAPKHKVFKVECETSPSPTPSGSPSETVSPSPSPTGSTSPSVSPSLPTESPSESPSESETPTTSISPTPGGGGKAPGGGSNLPITGTALAGLIGLALALLLGGGTAVFLARRRSQV